MPAPKPARRRGRKLNKVLEQPRLHWVLDNQTRRSCRTDQERRLWDLQDQLLALRGESKARQLSKVDEAIAFLYPYRGRAEQLEALRWLLFEKKDMILIAKTSFGKSMIMQAMPCLLRASVVIIILPLNAIGAEQKAKIEELPGTRPVHVYAETISARLLREIRIGVYTHILISPELLVGKRFHKTLTNPTFRAHVGLVVIDEVHLVANWGGSFRNSYTQLWKVRSLLGRKPWFACTATLDDTTFKIVQELAGFRNNINIVRTSIDRPDLSIIREYIKRGNKKDSIRSWLVHYGYQEAQARRAVQLYHASLAIADKDRLYKEFRKPNSEIRILLSSDALAHGADIPDIDCVAQYCMHKDKSVNMMWQRLGRGAR
ncbi:P-loop containing nucleoside triphosphate hydrolase protein, partial [Cenococcum geophilum 1.58]